MMSTLRLGCVLALGLGAAAGTARAETAGMVSFLSGTAKLKHAGASTELAQGGTVEAGNEVLDRQRPRGWSSRSPTRAWSGSVRPRRCS